MTTRRTASSIVELNNGALAHFIDGEYDKAIALLRVAYETFELHRMKPITMMMDSSSSSSLHPQANSFSFMECETTRGREELLLPTLMDCERLDGIIKEKSSSVRSLKKSNVDKNKKNSSPYGDLLDAAASSSSPPSTSVYSMYNRALVLSEQEDDFSMFVSNPSRTSAVILYNLALVHHNIGIHLGISSALPHALRLYEIAYQTIVDQDHHQHHHQVLFDVQKLLLALLNNMGNIYAHLFHFENTQRCLDHLRLVLAMSTPNYDTSMDEDYIFFFLNAIFQGKELCFAPAA